MGCTSSPSNHVKEEESMAADDIVVGFSQLGAESDWRSKNTESMKDAFDRMLGYQFIFEDGQQKQANQFTAIRQFIQQGVDYIVVAPVTETGWDTVLQEAHDADIPVIVVDRMVDVEDEELFRCWVGSDFALEGKKAAEWLHEYALMNNIDAKDLHIVDIQGTLGASAQIGRTKGLEIACEKYGWDLLAEREGDFTEAKGKEVVSALLKEYDNINVIYCENDNEALGAIEAVEEAGKSVGTNLPGGDILIISFDAVGEEALQYALEGKIACITECNPLHGPRVKAIIDAIEAGETPEKFEYVDEAVFSCLGSIDSVTVDGIIYPVTKLTQTIINERIE